MGTPAPSWREDDHNRFALLSLIGEARRYLQAEHERGGSVYAHPGDKACTIAHWTGLCRRVPDWFPPPRLP
jgi:hypothetical protein